MFGDGALTLREFAMKEPLPLATIQDLVDIRQTDQLPPNQLIADVRVPIPEELIAPKVISVTARSTQPKDDTDRRDVNYCCSAIRR